MRRGITALFALALLTDLIVFGNGQDAEYIESNDNGLPSSEPEDYTAVAVEEYIRRIHSMFDVRRGRSGRAGPVFQTDELIDTKYHMWKRNADLINSILALPKGMNDAGR
ncbi:pigment-dispersing hormone (PDH) domain-containing protein [Phthorimaea operculella]|nr:pigment-dispersing hormone (PDH) domain-containing protein [Phthorimaea operculella]